MPQTVNVVEEIRKEGLEYWGDREVGETVIYEIEFGDY